MKILFRVGLVLLKYGLRDKIIKKCPSMYEVLQELRNIDQRIMSEGFLLIQVSFGFFYLCNIILNRNENIYF